MKITCNELNKKFPVLIIIPCAAHIIQLCLKKICNLPKIKIIIDKVYEIIHLIKDNKVHNIKLLKLQIADNVKKPLKIIRPTEVRWSSIIFSIERLIDLEKYIKLIETNNDDEFWEQFKLLFILLQPIIEYTNRIQKDNASLHTVWICFNN